MIMKKHLVVQCQLHQILFDSPKESTPKGYGSKAIVQPGFQDSWCLPRIATRTLRARNMYWWIKSRFKIAEGIDPLNADNTKVFEDCFIRITNLENMINFGEQECITLCPVEKEVEMQKSPGSKEIGKAYRHINKPYRVSYFPVFSLLRLGMRPV